MHMGDIPTFIHFHYIPYAPCMVYLPTKLGDLCWANVGKYSIHGAYGYRSVSNYEVGEKLSRPPPITWMYIPVL